MSIKSILIGGLALGVPTFASTHRVHDLNKAEGMVQQELRQLATDIPFFYNELRECDPETRSRFSLATSLNKITFTANRNGGRNFTVNGSGAYPAPSFRSFKLAVVISQTPVRDPNPAPDRPTQYETKCDIEWDEQR